MRFARAGTVLVTLLLLKGCAELGVEPPVEQSPGPFEPPRLSVTARQAESVKSAYQQQRTAVQRVLEDRAPAGFKAGLTSVAGQHRFDMREPVAGVLWPNGQLALEGDTATVDRTGFAKPMLEVELAFRINTLIPEPLADVSEVHHVVSEVMPALELPDLGFESAVGLTGPAIIAANAGASRYVIGPAVAAERIDVNAVTAELSHNGRRVQDVEAVNVMGNQWRALYWLINKMVEEGWVIQPGQVLLSGAMGPMLPLENGIYQVDFSELSGFRLLVR